MRQHLSWNEQFLRSDHSAERESVGDAPQRSAIQFITKIPKIVTYERRPRQNDN
jgi:hypothetical protein